MLNKFYWIVVMGVLVNGIPTNCLASEVDNETHLVNRAIESIENCLHWGGEVGDQSEERNKQIMEGAKIDCAEAERYAKEAYEKNPNNIALASQMVRYVTEGYFTVNSVKFKELCSNAAKFYKKVATKDFPIRHWYFENKCLKSKDKSEEK